MRRTVSTFSFFLAALAVFAPCEARAWMLGGVGEWLTGEVAALLLSALAAVAGGAAGLVFVRVSRTFKEAGEFMTALGEALEDKRITRDELARMIKEGREIFEVWR